jgi:hypothetical protein
MASSSHNGKNAHAPATAAGSSAVGQNGSGQDQAAEFLTTAQGLRLPDTDHSLKAGVRGPDAARGLPPAREDHPLRS